MRRYAVLKLSREAISTAPQLYQRGWVQKILKDQSY